MSEKDVTTAAQHEDESAPSVETSLLFEKYAIWFWLACLVVAIWFSFVPLIAISTLLILISTLTIVWKEQSLKHIKATLSLNKTRVFTGDEFHVEASVQNDKWLPLVWLEWEFPHKSSIIWGDQNQEKYTIRLLWLLWYQRVNWTTKARAVKRGVYEIGQVSLRSGDGFRFTEKEIIHSFEQKLYIYPKLLSVQVPPFHSLMQWQIKGKQGGFLEDPLFVTGIREYQPGDEWKRLNWKASARSAKLLTNIYQPIVNEQLMISVDVTGFVIQENAFVDDPLEQQKYEQKKQDDFEWFLAVIASIAVTYQKQGVSIGFSSNACDETGRPQRTVAPSTNLPIVLDRLAEITALASSQGSSSYNKFLFEQPSSVPLLIFSETITEEQYRWYKGHQQIASVRGFYYLYDNEISDKLRPISKNMKLFVNEASLLKKGS